MNLDYGKDGLEITLDPAWNVTIFHPEKQPIIENPIQMIRDSLKNPIGAPPLGDIVKSMIEIYLLDPLQKATGMKWEEIEDLL